MNYSKLIYHLGRLKVDLNNDQLFALEAEFKPEDRTPGKWKGEFGMSEDFNDEMEIVDKKEVDELVNKIKKGQEFLENDVNVCEKCGDMRFVEDKIEGGAYG